MYYTRQNVADRSSSELRIVTVYCNVWQQSVPSNQHYFKWKVNS